MGKKENREKHSDKKQQGSWTYLGNSHITPEPKKYHELQPIQRFDSIQSDSKLLKKRETELIQENGIPPKNNKLIIRKFQT